MGNLVKLPAFGKKEQWSYDLMYQNMLIGTIAANGVVDLRGKLPYDLYLEECENDFDTRLMNLDNFRTWCANRVLTLDREHAKQILNACALSQATSEKERCKVALTYNCLSLRDSYWIRKNKEEQWDRLNLYENSLSNVCVDIALNGKNLAITDTYLIASDCSTNGVFPKAWVRKREGFYLYKGNRNDSVTKEVEASEILRSLGLNALEYKYGEWGGQRVSDSACFTSKRVGYVSAESYAWNQNLTKAVERFRQGFLQLVLATYLVGDVDCHWGNWGFLFEYRRLVGMVPIFDLNHAFEATNDTQSLPWFALGRSISQLDAAKEAAEQLGFVPKETNFDRFKYGDYVEERLRRLRESMAWD